MKRGSPNRYWKDAIAKCEEEGRCRLCGIERGLDAAHTIGRQFDEAPDGKKTLYVDPDSVVPLCRPCHESQEHNEVGILEVMTPAEQDYADRRLGSMESARRKPDPLDYRRDIQAARIEARLAA